VHSLPSEKILDSQEAGGNEDWVRLLPSENSGFAKDFLNHAPARVYSSIET